jgi:hypothetical protein
MANGGDSTFGGGCSADPNELIWPGTTTFPYLCRTFEKSFIIDGKIYILMNFIP